MLLIDSISQSGDFLGEKIEGNHEYSAPVALLLRLSLTFIVPFIMQSRSCVNSETQQWDRVGPKIEGERNHLAGGVVAANGIIYFAPHGKFGSVPNVLCIHPHMPSI